MLTLANICRTYQVGPIGVDVLKGVDLHVDKGELLSIMGTSGCGKSTLMNIIGLLDQPTSGEYRLDGREISALNDDTLSEIRNNKIGFVFQSFYLLSKLSATDNVGVPLIYRGMHKKEIAERAYEYLEKVGMHERGNHRPNELSGGQQQRIAIARALAGQPAILLADEPTGALDPNVGQEIMDLFVRLNEEEGITIIIITHDPGVARQCKRRVEVKDGVIVEE